jgi:hypothetical protein
MKSQILYRTVITLSIFVAISMFINVSSISASNDWEAQSVQRFGEFLCGVWGSSADNVYIVGGGTIFHYEGSGWSEIETPTSSFLNGIWGSSANDVFVVGDQCPILHYDGSQWTEQNTSLPTYPPSTLHGICGLSANDVFAVGKYRRWVGPNLLDESIILHYDGYSWHQTQDPTLNALYGIAQVSGKLFAVGDNGTILVYDWRKEWIDMESGTTAFLTSVWGSNVNDVFAVGGQGTILHYDGQDWSPMVSGTTEALWCVWGTSAENVYAAGYEGTLLHYDGQNWTVLDSGTTSILLALWGSSANDVFVVGKDETILHYNGSSWSEMEGVSKLHILGVWAISPSNVFAVARVSRPISAYGVILHYDGLKWSKAKAFPNDFPKGIWASSANDVFAVGVGKGSDGNPYGMVIHYDGKEWNKMETPAVNPLFAVWGSAPNDVFAVGSEGIILHYNGSAWSIMESGLFTSFMGVWGTSAADVFAVGGHGTILHYDGQDWSPMVSETTELLLDVWGNAANDVYAVGHNGTILHYDGNSWLLMISDCTTNFSGVWSIDANDVYVVGDEGIIQRYNGNQWIPHNSGTENILMSVHGVSVGKLLSHHAFAVGTDSTILRRRYYSYAPLVGTVQLPRTGLTTSYASRDDGEIQAGAPWPDPRYTDNEDGTVTDHLTGLMWLKDAGCLNRMSWYQAMNTIDGFNTNPGVFTCNGYTAVYNDWRLPNANEIESLVNLEPCSTGLWLTEQGYFDNVQHVYWSSTTYDYNPDWVFASGIGGFWDVGGDEPRVMCNGGLSDKSKDYSGDPQQMQIPAVWAVREKTTGPCQVWKTGQMNSYVSRDDGALQTGIAWPEPRFTDNGDGTVTDHLTGLMWLQDPLCFGDKTWEEALIAVSRFNASSSNYDCQGYSATYTDWRMANRKELQSLLDFSESAPILSPEYRTVFPRLQSGRVYWSSTTLNHCEGNNAFTLQLFAQGHARTIGFWEKSRQFQVWPIRGKPTVFVSPGTHLYHFVSITY